MRGLSYEVLDLSGDVGLRVWGANREQLFEHAGEALFSLITDTDKITVTESRQVSLKSDSYDRILVLWLNELIFLFDTYGFTGTSFSVTLSGFTLQAEISGGIIDPAHNESRLLLKAATYHGLSLKSTGTVWEAQVMFDI